MPFLPEVPEHRIWSVKNKKCLLLKKKESSVTFHFAGEGGKEEASSKVIPIEKPNNCPGYIGLYLVFQLDNGEKYVLGVKDDIVTAKKFTGKNPPENETYFVVKKIAGPFEVLQLGSDNNNNNNNNNNKYLAVNIKEDKPVVEGLKDTQPNTFDDTLTLVICDAGI